MKHTTEVINLEGGSKLLLVNVPGTTGFRLNTFVRAGTKYVPKDKFEIAHLLEHLAFNGTKELPTKMQFAYETEKDGAYTNATTTDDTISYLYESSISEYQRITDIACNQLAEPLFEAQEIINEKEVVVSELARKLSNDRARCGYNGWYLKVIAHSLPIEPRIESLQQITKKDIEKYHEKYHVANNVRIVAGGDFSGDRKKKFIQQLNTKLASLQSGKAEEFIKSLRPDYKKVITIQKPTSKNLSCFEFDVLKPEYDLSISPQLHVLKAMYGSGTFSRLFDKVRAAGLSYGVSAGYGIGKDISNFGMSDQTEHHKLFPLYEMCLKELHDILQGNFTSQELDRAKGYISGRFERSYDRAEDLGYFYESRFIDDDPLESPTEYVKLIKKVKPIDITDLNKSFFKKGSWILSLVGNDIDETKYRKITEKYFG